MAELMPVFKTDTTTCRDCGSQSIDHETELRGDDGIALNIGMVAGVILGALVEWFALGWLGLLCRIGGS